MNNLMTKNRGLMNKLELLQGELKRMREEKEHFKCSHCKNDSIQSSVLLKEPLNQNTVQSITEKSTPDTKILK